MITKDFIFKEVNKIGFDNFQPLRKEYYRSIFDRVFEQIKKKYKI